MKWTTVVLATALSLFFTFPALAQDQTGQSGAMMGAGRASGQMMNQGQMRPCGFRHMGMMGSLMGGSMVATSDGGVVLFFGQKLMKFDKNLKLVKEVEVKVDPAALQKTMQEMWRSCPRGWKGGMGPRGGRWMRPGPGQAPPPQPQEQKK